MSNKKILPELEKEYISKFINDCESELVGKAYNYQMYQMRKLFACHALALLFLKNADMYEKYQEFRDKRLKLLADIFKDADGYEFQEFFEWFDGIKKYTNH